MNEQPTTRTPRASASGGAGTVIAGRYVIQRVIARGGMATVYLGEDNLLSRPVAIKVLSGNSDPDVQDAFLDEARAVAKLSHPNIVDVYDAGIEGSTRYIVMQYVPGGTLRDIIQRDAPLDPRRAVDLTVKIADALNFGHTRGIVHCDVKPGNVLLGDQGEPKIVDFGIAQSLTQGSHLSDTVAGTVGYISPEQVEGRSVDGRTDVYSLAAVLYEMLTGTPPVAGDDLQSVVSQRQVRTPAPLQDRNPFVPDELSEIVMRGLARDPAGRYPTAKAFSDALRGYSYGQSDARTRTAIRPVDPATERIPVQRRPQRTAAPQTPAVARERGRQPWLFLVVAGTLLAVLVALVVVLTLTLTAGGGSGTVTVPTVTGTRLDNAATTIQRTGLRVAEVDLQANPAPFGTVINQQPEAGESLRRGGAVNLIVSVGSGAP
jgi:hypothetical protein